MTLLPVIRIATCNAKLAWFDNYITLFKHKDKMFDNLKIPIQYGTKDYAIGFIFDQLHVDDETNVSYISMHVLVGPPSKLKEWYIYIPDSDNCHLGHLKDKPFANMKICVQGHNGLTMLVIEKVLLVEYPS